MAAADQTSSAGPNGSPGSSSPPSKPSASSGPASPSLAPTAAAPAFSNTAAATSATPTPRIRRDKENAQRATTPLIGPSLTEHTPDTKLVCASPQIFEWWFRARANRR